MNFWNLSGLFFTKFRRIQQKTENLKKKEELDILTPKVNNCKYIFENWQNGIKMIYKKGSKNKSNLQLGCAKTNINSIIVSLFEVYLIWEAVKQKYIFFIGRAIKALPRPLELNGRQNLFFSRKK